MNWSPSNPHRTEREGPKAKGLLGMLGPGFITGASDDDPSGIGTYAMAGASAGYSTLWTALVCLPMMIVVQYLCAKIGLVNGMGLAGVLRKHYPRWLLMISVLGLLIANTLNAGADIGAVAEAIRLLVPLPALPLIVAVTIGILALQIAGSYRLIERTFKWLALALLAYVGSAFFSHPDYRQVLYATLVPKLSWDPAFLSILVAILGTTISPYLFFWQADQEVEEELSAGRKRLWQRRGATDDELQYAATDVNIGMFFSQVVMYFIILSTAATLHVHHVTNIESAAQAAEALRPLAGNGAKVLLALGLIGSGVLAIPILTSSAAYAVSQAMGWRFGLDVPFYRARQFYIVAGISTLVGMTLNFLHINPIKALFWTAVINGFLAPPLLVLIMLVSNNRTIMGDRTNRPLTNVIGWATTATMFAAAAALVLTWGKT